MFFIQVILTRYTSSSFYNMIDVFEESAHEYDDWFSCHEIAYRSELAAVRSLLPLGRGMEIGVGTGRFAAPLRIEVGVEPAQAMAKFARNRGINVIRVMPKLCPWPQPPLISS
jgi:hypothetical protein